MDFTDFPTGESDHCSVRWTHEKGGGAIILDGSVGEYLKFEVLDGLDDLVEHYVAVQGWKELA